MPNPAPQPERLDLALLKRTLENTGAGALIDFQRAWATSAPEILRRLDAADRLAKRMFNWQHGDGCHAEDADYDGMCAACESGKPEECSCTCEIDAALRDCLIIRPMKEKLDARIT